MELILEEILSNHIIKKSKKSWLECLKRFSCKSSCMINEEEIENLEKSKNELIEFMKLLKKKNSDSNIEFSLDKSSIKQITMI